MNWRYHIKSAGRFLIQLAESCSSRKPHVLFFLGAGVSHPSGLPLADEMERHIFGDDLEWYGSGTMRFGEPRTIDNGGEGRRTACEVRAFLRVLQHIVQDAFDRQAAGPTGHDPHEAGYEDLYYACDQILASEMGYGRGPAVPLLAEHMREKARPHLQSYPHAQGGRVTYVPYVTRTYTNLAWTATLGKLLIRSVVSDRLSQPTSSEGLDAVLEAACGEEAGRVTVVTLNHDCLIEELLERHGLYAADPSGFEDGFGEAVVDSDLRPYEAERLFSPDARVRIIKPHGSINWYPVKPRRSGVTPGPPKGASRFSSEPDEVSRFPNEFAALCGPPPYSAGRKVIWPKDKPAAECIRPANPTASVPLLLTSYGKDREYGREIFGDMMSASLQSLREADVIFVSGFGWNDPGMRDRLLGALRHSETKRLFILHQRSEEERKNRQLAGGLSEKTADPFRARDQLHPFDKWLCDFTWEELWCRSETYLP